MSPFHPPSSRQLRTYPTPTTPFLLLPLFCLLLSLLLLPCPSHAQQPYVNNKQLDCYGTNAVSTLGYSCDASSDALPCRSFLMFRSQTNYQTPIAIGYLLNAQPGAIARINGVNDVDNIPVGTLVIVPLDCSCTAGGQYYQHDASYVLKYTGETYFVVANNTYQGLTTCQALMAQNPSHESRNLTEGMNISVPLRCACPSRSQSAAGFKYLLSYLVTWGDNIDTIAGRFHVSTQAVLDANNLTEEANIYPFTTVLVPLPTEPTKDETLSPPPPPPPPSLAPPPSGGGGGSNKKWVFVGIGLGAGAALLLLLVVAWFFCRRGRSRPLQLQEGEGQVKNFNLSESVEHGSLSGKMQPPMAIAASSSFSGKIRNVLESLTVYTFEELEKATGSFSEDHRIRGSVYRGVINGDAAAVKRLKGDVSNEINILKQINHSNVIRLSGFCLHEGDTYLVYEFAEKGSLSDWIHHQAKDWSGGCLDWKQRVRIACDVADGLNYLHNYANSPCIHKDLKSSNILLDSVFRAKVANFGLARPMEGGEGVALTRHVVGTQGYMAPEYLEHGLITPKLDVFAFGVVLLELLSGEEAVYSKAGEAKMECLLSGSIRDVLSGENVREKLQRFMDPCLHDEYPFDLAFAVSQLAMRCVVEDPNSRPTMGEVLVSLSAIYSSCMDWDSSDVPQKDLMGRGR